ncbi:MAG: hypothetical protein WBD41_27860 [Rhodococcus sp. (in: high G+C Gram-positive bacteria)]|jgi:hypothetical protein
MTDAEHAEPKTRRVRIRRPKWFPNYSDDPEFAEVPAETADHWDRDRGARNPGELGTTNPAG